MPFLQVKRTFPDFLFDNIFEIPTKWNSKYLMTEILNIPKERINFRSFWKPGSI